MNAREKAEYLIYLAEEDLGATRSILLQFAETIITYAEELEEKIESQNYYGLVEDLKSLSRQSAIKNMDKYLAIYKEQSLRLDDLAQVRNEIVNERSE